MIADEPKRLRLTGLTHKVQRAQNKRVTARKDGKFLNPVLAQFLIMFLTTGKRL
jgi:hypothetical protein